MDRRKFLTKAGLGAAGAAGAATLAAPAVAQERIEMAIFEFHELDKNEKIFISSIKKLQEKFMIVHLHGNNHCPQTLEGLPIALEMTFINKRYQPEKIDYIKKFPRDYLDHPNNPYKEDLAFYFE